MFPNKFAFCALKTLFDKDELGKRDHLFFIQTFDCQGSVGFDAFLGRFQ